MKTTSVTGTSVETSDGSRCRDYLLLLWNDKLAFLSTVFVTFILICAFVGPWLFAKEATSMNLMLRNAPPFQLKNGFWLILGGDTLGRSVLARIAVASANTLLVAGLAVSLSLVIGTALGLSVGLRSGWAGTITLRCADILMSFPSLLLAMIALYVFKPGMTSVVLVMALTRLPVYIRTVRAETLEVRERMFVLAARTMGASTGRIVFKHILPVVLPTLLTIATLEFAFVMLTEASLSFLGLGIQPPEVSWGLMVAEGRNYLQTAWWIAFWPGLAIMLTTTSLNLLSNWLRVATDPKQRWRLEKRSGANA
ncbi:MAG: ABC transporter permease [Ensifer sp. SSB1]|nr:ABC transporter permease [Ensifer sp. SSB1]